MQTITARIQKHVYVATGFDIFSAVVLLDDPENNVIVDKTFGTLTIKGSNLESLSEGDIYTLGLTLLPSSNKYPDAYRSDLLLKAYPNISEQQILFIDKLLNEPRVSDMASLKVWSEVKNAYLTAGKELLDQLLNERLDKKGANGDDGDNDNHANNDTAGDPKTTAAEDVFSEFVVSETTAEGVLGDDDNGDDDDSDDDEAVNTLDLVKYYKDILRLDSPTSPILKMLTGLQPFSPIAQYLMSQRGVSQTDALALVNAYTTTLPKFKAIESNIFSVYHNAQTLPIDALIRVQQILNPNSDLTPANPFFLDSAIRHHVERNLYDSNNDYLTMNDLIGCLNQSFPVAYDWVKILANYAPQKNAKFKVVKLDGETYFTPNVVFYSSRTIHKFFLNAKEFEIEPLVEMGDLKPRFNLPFEPSAEQSTFIEQALTSKMTLLTGAAGTGKSGTIAALTSILVARGIKLELLAPTAKAAQQLMKYSGQPARTIHSWLASNKEADPHEFDKRYIIMDEMSMADEELCAKTLAIIAGINSVKSDNDAIHLVWAGDIDQLLPVGYGAPFRDALNLYPEMTTRLTKIYRQSNPDLIDVLQVASKGNFQVTNLYTNPGLTHVTSKVAYMPYTSAEQVAATIAANIPNYTPETYFQFGVISPVNNTVSALNSAIQSKLNPTSLKPNVVRQLLRGQNDVFAEGDPIVLTRIASYISVDALRDALRVSGELSQADIVRFERMCRNHSSKLTVPQKLLNTCFNGDTGFVSKVVSPNAFIIIINTPSGTKEVLIHSEHLTFSNIELAYAITVHKAQGSQYKHVIYVNTRSRDSMSGRNMVYTAMSRAQEDVLIFSNALFSNVVENRLTLWPKLYKTSLQKG